MEKSQNTTTQCANLSILQRPSLCSLILLYTKYITLSIHALLFDVVGGGISQ